jgi:hypothetical protein
VNFEIRVERTIHGFFAKAFLNGSPANCFSHSIDFSDATSSGWKWNYDEEPAQKLIDMVKDDIIKGWGIEHKAICATHEKDSVMNIKPQR